MWPLPTGANVSMFVFLAYLLAESCSRTAFKSFYIHVLSTPGSRKFVRWVCFAGHVHIYDLENVSFWCLAMVSALTTLANRDFIVRWTFLRFPSRQISSGSLVEKLKILLGAGQWLETSCFMGTRWWRKMPRCYRKIGGVEPCLYNYIYNCYSIPLSTVD